MVKPKKEKPIRSEELTPLKETEPHRVVRRFFEKIGKAEVTTLNHTDPEEIFRFFVFSMGDLVKTAALTGRTPEEVRAMAAERNWMGRIAPLLKLYTSTRPGDLERAMNRASNFVQADRYRAFLDRMLRVICNTDPRQLEELCVSAVTDRFGSTTWKLATRPFADLATALEKCHAMTYAALQDTATERREREQEGDPDTNIGQQHIDIASALSRKRAEAGEAQSLPSPSE
jgi:hypothetical protein